MKPVVGPESREVLISIFRYFNSEQANRERELGFLNEHMRIKNTNISRDFYTMYYSFH